LTQIRQLIAWDIHHQTLNKQPIKQHQQLINYIYDWLPTGHVVHQHDRNEDHHCPHCRTVFEKDLHLLRCPHPSRTAQRDRFLTIHLHHFYHKSNTAQPLHKLISQNIIQWFRQPNHLHHTARTHPLFQEASIEHQAIGWHHFFQGQTATSIINYQEEAYY
jgi:hypothetical protein